MKLFITTELAKHPMLVVQPMAGEDPGIYDVPHLTDIHHIDIQSIRDRSKVMDAINEIGLSESDLSRLAVSKFDDIIYAHTNTTMQLREPYEWRTSERLKNIPCSMAVRYWEYSVNE